MNVEMNIDELGDADIELAGLRIWVHSREYPEHNTFWDGNWLIFTAHCKAQGASIWFTGSHLRNTEIADWIIELKRLNETLSGEVNLDTLESGLAIKINPRTYGRISINIDITPDKIFQKHSFEFWLDQSYLNDLIGSCRRVLKKFPIRGSADN